MMATIFHARGVPDIQAPREVRERMRPSLAKAGLSTDVAERFMLAMSEILVNLAEHSTPPPSSFSIAVRRNKGTVRMDITDDGGPISPRVFTGEALEMGELREHGLGLAMVKAMFDSMVYEAAPDDGFNRFFVDIDVGPEIEDRRTVLLVDDDPTLLYRTELLLANDFSVIAVTSAEEAISALDVSDIDLIISDIRMPDMDGLDFRHQLSGKDETALIPFIFMTGSDSTVVREKANWLSIDDYLIKPVQKDSLIETINRCLRRSMDLKRRHGDVLDKTITRALAPSLPSEVPGFVLAARSSAAEAGGGDLLFTRRHAGGTMIVLADLMGHGEQAKFFSHAYAGFFRGLFESIPAKTGPADVLNILSKALLNESILSDTFLTCLIADLKEDGHVKLASGGHPPALFWNGSQASVLDIDGPLPGLLPDFEYEETTLVLGRGERLAMYTDGLFERLPTVSPDLLPPRLFEAFQNSTVMPVEVAAEDMFMGLSRELNGFTDDDATLAIIEGRPEADNSLVIDSEGL